MQINEHLNEFFRFFLAHHIFDKLSLVVCAFDIVFIWTYLHTLHIIMMNVMVKKSEFEAITFTEQRKRVTLTTSGHNLTPFDVAI